MKITLIKSKEQLQAGTTKTEKTLEQVHAELLKLWAQEDEQERLNITGVRDLVEAFWNTYPDPSDQIKYRKEIQKWVETMTSVLITYWGEGSKVSIDKCHRKFHCLGPDGREVWI